MFYVWMEMLKGYYTIQKDQYFVCTDSSHYNAIFWLTQPLLLPKCTEIYTIYYYINTLNLNDTSEL
jgi:hypothetical protein